MLLSRILSLLWKFCYNIAKLPYGRNLIVTINKVVLIVSIQHHSNFVWHCTNKCCNLPFRFFHWDWEKIHCEVIIQVKHNVDPSGSPLKNRPSSSENYYCHNLSSSRKEIITTYNYFVPLKNCISKAVL